MSTTLTTTSAPAKKDTVLVLNSGGGGWLPAFLVDTNERKDELRKCFEDFHQSRGHLRQKIYFSKLKKVVSLTMKASKPGIVVD